MKSLKIGLPLNHPVRGIAEPPDEPTFSQLVSLEASLADDTDGLRLLRLIRSKVLRKLSIFFPATCNTDRVDEFLQVLRTDHPNLTDITLATLATSPHDIHIVGAPVSIRAFDAFTSLTSLSIGLHLDAQADHYAVFRALLDSCRSLRHLDIACSEATWDMVCFTRARVIFSGG